MKIRDVILIFGVGLAMHQTASITQKMPKGWGYLAGIVFGVEATILPFDHLLKRFGLPDDVRARAIAAYQLAFLCVGSGVAFGWILDTIFNVKRD
jgi:hypothetical protein